MDWQTSHIFCMDTCQIRRFTHNVFAPLLKAGNVPIACALVPETIKECVYFSTMSLLVRMIIIIGSKKIATKFRLQIFF